MYICTTGILQEISSTKGRYFVKKNVLLTLFLNLELQVLVLFL